ncbi:hypothetical protein NDU88_001260 [Pleurodeles waltl]|uniref:Uncharacterized protein n=1 Tax=Pleurodeles waltl TaxID=8319 RepID=A0AAV7LZ39_PLEWA|nr:hypothetical protein NDU88_001260 [Pleurodeles waltl]
MEGRGSGGCAASPAPGPHFSAWAVGLPSRANLSSCGDTGRKHTTRRRRHPGFLLFVTKQYNNKPRETWRAGAGLGSGVPAGTLLQGDHKAHRSLTVHFISNQGN